MNFLLIYHNIHPNHCITINYICRYYFFAFLSPNLFKAYINYLLEKITQPLKNIEFEIFFLKSDV